ncbi:hypothetical protein HDV03_004127 [Kappamyces sp. JEL0829]|nr:hypothetical protein HDV03_004127 [Kappamyces sp. JEL0829]
MNSLEKTATEVASLSVALLQSGSFQTLLSMSSPHLIERHLLLGATLQPIEWFSWTPQPDVPHLLSGIAIEGCPRLPPYFKVLDEETTLASQPFVSASGHHLLAILLLSPDFSRWLFHDAVVVKVTHVQQWHLEEGWSEKVQDAKKSYALKPPLLALDATLASEREDAQYWSRYDEASKAVGKRPLDPAHDQESSEKKRNVESDDDYWDQY